MSRKWVVDLVTRLPQGAVSRAWGWLARRKHPVFAVRALQRVFVRATGIRMNEAAQPEFSAYATLEDLFVRRLRAGMRPLASGSDAVISPVDGAVGQLGLVRDGTALQAKGRAYSIAELLGDAREAAAFEGGVFATLYLSPKDYHRIHAPIAGVVRQARVIPGGLLPVFQDAIDSIDRLFARNERIVTYLDVGTGAKGGRVAVVKVGATLVGRISLAFDPTVWSNQRGGERRDLAYDPPHVIPRGGDVGAFELGSTVVLIATPGLLELSGLSEGMAVQMGQRIGRVLANATDGAVANARGVAS